MPPTTAPYWRVLKDISTRISHTATWRNGTVAHATSTVLHMLSISLHRLFLRLTARLTTLILKSLKTMNLMSSQLTETKLAWSMPLQSRSTHLPNKKKSFIGFKVRRRWISFLICWCIGHQHSTCLSVHTSYQWYVILLLISFYEALIRSL